MCLCLLVILAGVLTFLVIKIKKALFKYPPKPVLPETWWGPGSSPESEDTEIRPFKIQISDEVIKDLKDRLSRHRPFIPPLEGVQHQYGINSNLLNKIVEYWKNEYNWKERETLLNKYPHFKTKIQGLNIHFLHVKPTTALPEDVQVLPILLLHGWPGSVKEFYNIIPLLTTPRADQKFVFEVIVPSLPGYGFSDAAVRPSLGAPQAAVIFKNLMIRLGFEKFYVQGGDWGAIITSDIAAMFPQNVLGLHCNMPVARSTWATLKQFLGSFYPSWVVDKQNQHRVYPLKKFFANVLLETGYMHLQATKPDTIGIALNDTPVGLAAYILEKFISWTDYSLIGKEDGGLERKFKLDDLLDNVMIYWVTESITTSVRLYAENFTKENRKLELESVPIEVPTALALFKNEFYYTPPSLLSERYKNVLQLSNLPDGGHFAAMEVPQILADDIWQATEKIQRYRRYIYRE